MLVVSLRKSAWPAVLVLFSRINYSLVVEQGHVSDYCESGSGIFDSSFASLDGVESVIPSDISSVYVSADVHFCVMFRYGYLALQLLADKSMPGEDILSLIYILHSVWHEAIQTSVVTRNGITMFIVWHLVTSPPVVVGCKQIVEYDVIQGELNNSLQRVRIQCRSSHCNTIKV